MSDFSDTVILVTGGTRGIGRACVEAFAQKGGTVAFCGRSQETVDTVATEIAEATSATVKGYQADISNDTEVDALVKAVTEDLGAPTILVNNAGITKDGLLMRMKNDAWDEVMQTNLSSAFYTCRAVSRGMMKARYGRIINLSSIVGVHGQAGQANYAASKAGLIGFSKSLAQEFASRNISVNVITPGYINTDMTAELNEDALNDFVEKIPAKRAGSPEEIASATVFLASRESAYITGHVLAVDGGLGM
jgi:3-oxoacyl-[acyl-carrier protein] reductase